MEFVYIFIPLLPLLAFVVLALGGSQFQGNSHKVGIPAIVGSFALSVLAFVQVLRTGPIEVPLYTLLQSGTLSIDLGLYIDQLTVLLLLLVSGVSSVVHVYSSRYMIGDSKYNRFFAVISLFTFSMLMLVMSRNLLMLYVFWEVMGLCSYLLISHAADRRSAGLAATKAFLVNAVADVGFGLGVILTFATFGTLDIPEILAKAPAMTDHTVNVLGWIGLDLQLRSVTLISLLLFMGAMGKSAQFPFHVWLPYAMEAPTPVSALIHAATMVNAGPFLLVRLSPLLVLSPVAMTFIAVIGATTALFAGIVSLTQSDIKKILAYSTISQIGFMIMACGLGAFVVAIFHLLAHGCYKAFFFLSTGNALASVEPGHGHGQDDHRKPQGMGTLYGGALLLACLPPFILFSGPYEHLWGVTGFASATIGFRIIGLITVFVTSVYLFKSITSLFVHGPKTYWPAIGQSGSDHSIIRPQFMNGSILMGLLVTTLILGMVLTLFWNWFAGFLAPALALADGVVGEGTVGVDFSIWLLVALGVAVGGWAFAFSMHANPWQQVGGSANWKARLYVLFWNKLYIDEIYDAYIVNPTVGLAQWLSHHAEGLGMKERMETVGRCATMLTDVLALAKPRLIGQNILVLIFGFVCTMGLLYVLS
jgi:NADH-quinone oxidoreductase subunit L